MGAGGEGGGGGVGGTSVMLKLTVCQRSPNLAPNTSKKDATLRLRADSGEGSSAGRSHGGVAGVHHARSARFEALS